MAYESKIYIVEKTSLKDNDGMRYANIIAMFDMCNMGSLVDAFQTKTDCYFFTDDGNTKVLEDKYGDVLTESTIEDVIYELEKLIDNGEKYRRLFPLLSTLKTISEQQKKGICGDIVLLHYGY